MLVYTVQATLLWCTAWAIARRNKAGKLQEYQSQGPRTEHPRTQTCASPTSTPLIDLTHHVVVSQTRQIWSITYRLLASLTLGCADWIVVFCDVQMQKMVVWKVFLTFGAPVHVRLLVVHIVLLKGIEGKRLMRGKRAPHDGGVVSYGGVGIEVDNLYIDRLLARRRCARVF